MKTFKQLLWFIVPTVLIGVLLYIFTFADTTNLPKFVGMQNYLRLFLYDSVFLRALFITIALPLLFVTGIGVTLFLMKQFLFRDKYGGVFYAVCFISTSFVFHFTANLKLFMGLPPAAYSSRVLVSASALLIQPNIPAILISMQVGVIICFIYWCADKITQKLKTKKVDKLKKTIVFLALICICFSGCSNSNKQSYDFKSQGIRVTISCNKDWILTTDDQESSSAIAFFENEEKNNMYGHITFNNCDKQYNNIDDVLQDYSQNNDKCIVAKVSDNLRFIEYKGVFPANSEPNYWYMFLYYDSEINATAFGRFSYDKNDKEKVLNLAKSISLKQIEKVSPYPDDYTLIKPTITIQSSGEKVTDYCVVAKRWKNFDYDIVPPETVLKDKKAYVLSDDDNIKYNSEDYTANSFNANFEYGSIRETLFLEGTSFKIRKWDENVTDEFYVCITAKFGASGEIQYVFKCRYE